MCLVGEKLFFQKMIFSFYAVGKIIFRRKSFYPIWRKLFSLKKLGKWFFRPDFYGPILSLVLFSFNCAQNHSIFTLILSLILPLFFMFIIFINDFHRQSLQLFLKFSDFVTVALLKNFTIWDTNCLPVRHFFNLGLISLKVNWIILENSKKIEIH